MKRAVREKEGERKEKGNERKRKRKREIGRGRARERERERIRERERERKGCFWKRPTFLLLAPGSALEQFAAIVNPENKPTKLNWTLSWPSALEMCGELDKG